MYIEYPFSRKSFVGQHFVSSIAHVTDLKVSLCTNIRLYRPTVLLPVMVDMVTDCKHIPQPALKTALLTVHMHMSTGESPIRFYMDFRPQFGAGS